MHISNDPGAKKPPHGWLVKENSNSRGAVRRVAITAFAAAAVLLYFVFGEQVVGLVVLELRPRP